MKKIISLFERNYDGDKKVRNAVVAGAEWVTRGEGVATRKFDGTAVLIREGKLYKRFDAKQGKPTPPHFEPAQEPDPITGHFPGWIPVGDEPDSRYHRKAFARGVDWRGNLLHDGTYELCGEKINGNPERLTGNVLIPHGQDILEDAPRDFEGLRDYLGAREIEGIVWWHPDGRMVKIKKKDFALTPAPIANDPQKE